MHIGIWPRMDFPDLHCMWTAGLTAAYEALKGFNLLRLPSRATLQAYTGAFIDDPGEVQSTYQFQYILYTLIMHLYTGAYHQKRIAEAVVQYRQFCNDKVKQGSH